MAYGSGPIPPSWPVTSDPGPKIGPRPDGYGATLLILAGIAGLVPWFTGSYLIGAESASGVSLTGKKVFLGLRDLNVGGTHDLTAFAVLGATIAGGALILMGLAALIPMTHRPIGAAALALTALLAAAAGWMLLKSDAVFGTSLPDMITGGRYGWHLIVIAAFFALLGSVRTLTARQ